LSPSSLELPSGGSGEVSHDTHRPIHRRVFIGGCSRSGTTLLQRLLVGHPRIHTFPETGVFLRALGMRGHVLPWARLGLTLGKERKSLIRLIEQVGVTDAAAPPLPPRRLRLRSSIQDVVRFLDLLTLAEGKDIWLEKTPRHVLHASRIRRMVPASMEDPGHLILRYERLASHPRETLRKICAHLGIDFREEMLEASGQTGFVLEDEVWKAPPRGPLHPAASKCGDIFDETERKVIDEALEERLFNLIEERLRSAPGQVWTSGNSPAERDSPGSLS
jgi:hypothetical protein